MQHEFKDIDYVFHQAALAAVPRSVRDPIATNNSNITGTLNVLVAARDNKVKRVIYAGSSSAYGDTPTLPKREDMIPSPLSPYAISKLTGEYYCRVFSNVYGLDTVTLRYFNVFGPMQSPDSQYAAVIPLFIKSINNNSPPRIFGDGEQTRDFTFIRNVIEANILAMNCPEKLKGEVINIATHSRITLMELVAKLNQLLGKDVKPIHNPEREGDIKHSFADIEKAKRLLNYSPIVSFEDGLKKTIEWLNQKGI